MYDKASNDFIPDLRQQLDSEQHWAHLCPPPDVYADTVAVVATVIANSDIVRMEKYHV